LGDHLRFTTRTSTGSKHLLRCHFFAPDGSFIPAYARNVLVDGSQGEVVLPSAQNDAPGEYRLSVADLVSGAVAEHSFTLR